MVCFQVVPERVKCIWWTDRVRKGIQRNTNTYTSILWLWPSHPYLTVIGTHCSSRLRRLDGDFGFLIVPNSIVFCGQNSQTMSHTVPAFVPWPPTGTTLRTSPDTLARSQTPWAIGPLPNGNSWCFHWSDVISVVWSSIGKNKWQRWRFVQSRNRKTNSSFHWKPRFLWRFPLSSENSPFLKVFPSIAILSSDSSPGIWPINVWQSLAVVVLLNAAD